jgi:hypothetical protein
VALENTFRHLTHQLRGLRDNIAAVQVTAREDMPAIGRVMAVDAFSDAVDEALGWIEESLASALQAQSAVGNPPDLQAARLSLVPCHERFHRFEQKFFLEVVSYGRLRDLMIFTKCRGGEWVPWVRSIRLGLDQCAPPVDEAGKALLDCWQELAERVCGSSISVQNNLGRLVLQTPERD